MNAMFGVASRYILADTEHLFRGGKLNGDGRDDQEIGRACCFSGLNFSLEEPNGQLCQLVQAIERLLQRHAVQASLHLLASEVEHHERLLEEGISQTACAFAIVAEATELQVKWQHRKLPFAHFAGPVGDALTTA